MSNSNVRGRFLSICRSARGTDRVDDCDDDAQVLGTIRLERNMAKQPFYNSREKRAAGIELAGKSA
jgi:hypothetical protein